MGRGRMRWLAGLLLLALWVAKPASGAEEVPGAGGPSREFFPLAEVRPGLVGQGWTVVEGDRIEPFQVEVLGLLPNEGPAGALILVRTYGGAIERTGGIAAGMSGSPVYVDGRLLGAIGYGFALSDHRVGVVTPIQSMYDVLRQVPARQTAFSSRGEIGEADERGGSLALVPLDTPLLTSLGGRARQLLGEIMAPWRLRPVAAGLSPLVSGPLAGVPAANGDIGGQEGSPPTASSSQPVVPLRPGSAIGVQLVRGDVAVTAIGTVTYTEGDRFVAFGHPFLQRGPVDFAATSVWIHGIVKGLDQPFKVGSPLQVVGRVLQDRAAAIGGRWEEAWPALPVVVRVTDADRGSSQTFRFEVARDEQLSVPLLAVGALDALDRALGRVGAGTATARLTVRAAGLADVVRENVYFSSYDVAAASLLEPVNGLHLLLTNEFQPLTLSAVELDVTVQAARRTARIEKAKPLQREVRPGQRLAVEVVLRPFRGQPETRRVEVTVPADAQPGPWSLLVRGGGWGGGVGPLESLPTQVTQPGNAPGSEEKKEEEPEQPAGTADSLEGLIERFVQRERNTDLVIEPLDEGASPEGDLQHWVPGGSTVPEEGGPVAAVYRALVSAATGRGGVISSAAVGAGSGEAVAAAAPGDGVTRRRPRPAEGGRPPSKTVVDTAYVLQGSAVVTVTVSGAEPAAPSATAPGPQGQSDPAPGGTGAEPAPEGTEAQPAEAGPNS